MARYTEEGPDYQDNMERLLKKTDTARDPGAARRSCATAKRTDEDSARSITARPARR